jgi:hypothetical protein
MLLGYFKHQHLPSNNNENNLHQEYEIIINTFCCN